MPPNSGGRNQDPLLREQCLSPQLCYAQQVGGTVQLPPPLPGAASTTIPPHLQRPRAAQPSRARRSSSRLQRTDQQCRAFVELYGEDVVQLLATVGLPAFWAESGPVFVAGADVMKSTQRGKACECLELVRKPAQPLVLGPERKKAVISYVCRTARFALPWSLSGRRL